MQTTGHDYVDIKPTDMINIYHVVSITQFRNFRPRNVIAKFTPSSVFEFATEQAMNGFTVFEVLKNDFMRIYLDLENISVEEPNMYKNIITAFAAFANINLNTVAYGITLNKGSHHPGLSYHVVFGAVTFRDNLKSLVQRFKLAYPEFEKFVDASIYTRNRLFRLPDQISCDIRAESDRYRDIPESWTRDADSHRIIELHNCGDNNLKTHYDMFIIQDISNSSNYQYLRLWRPIAKDNEDKTHEPDNTHDKNFSKDDFYPTSTGGGFLRNAYKYILSFISKS